MTYILRVSEMFWISLALTEGVRTGKGNNFLHFSSEKSEVRIYTKGLKGLISSFIMLVENAFSCTFFF